MTKRQKPTAKPLFLGIECGGTRSTFLITEDEPAFIGRASSDQPIFAS